MCTLSLKYFQYNGCPPPPKLAIFTHLWASNKKWSPLESTAPKHINKNTPLTNHNPSNFPLSWSHVINSGSLVLCTCLKFFFTDKTWLWPWPFNLVNRDMCNLTVQVWRKSDIESQNRNNQEIWTKPEQNLINHGQILNVFKIIMSK